MTGDEATNPLHVTSMPQTSNIKHQCLMPDTTPHTSRITRMSQTLCRITCMSHILCRITPHLITPHLITPHTLQRIGCGIEDSSYLTHLAHTSHTLCHTRHLIHHTSSLTYLIPHIPCASSLTYFVACTTTPHHSQFTPYHTEDDDTRAFDTIHMRHTPYTCITHHTHASHTIHMHHTPYTCITHHKIHKMP